MNKLVIFDFDGVIADSLQPMLNYAGQVCLEMGYPCKPAQADLEALDKMEFTEFGRQLGIPEDKIGDFVNRNFNLFTQREEPLEIIPGMDSVIKKLSRTTILVVITGNSCAVVSRFMNTYELNNLFHMILGAEDGGSRVEKINKVVSRNDRSRKEVYMIGDAVSDIRAATETGIKSIAVSWGHQSKAKLLGESPDYLVEEPQDLLTILSD